MKAKMLSFLKRIGIYLVALSIPAFLIIGTLQARHYDKIENDVANMEKMQTELIEANKAYITDISVLSSSERIEKIAVEELGMHKAETKEIVRVSIKGK